MRHISELEKILRSQLTMDKRKVSCAAQIIIAMVVARTVSLGLLAKHLTGGSKLSSRYRRVQRLLHEWPETMDWIGPWLLTWFYDVNDVISLTMDRTNWQYGKAKINFLVVGVTYKRMAIPLMWSLLPKKGNSNCLERIALLERVLKYVDQSRIKNLLCDREFVGKHWLGWLGKQKIPFKIRIKDNYLALTTGGKETTVEALFYHLPRGKKVSLQGARYITKERIKVYLSASRLNSGELMVVASDSPDESAIEAYCERWEIETLFENLKSRGFDLEATHMVDPKRLSALMTLVSIAACWCYRTGEWLIEQGHLIKIKKHGRPSVSLFRHGLDKVADTLCKPNPWKVVRPLVRIWDKLRPPAIIKVSLVL